MTNPSLGGFTIFGRSIRMRTVKDASAEQINHFFGLQGVERIHGGIVGRITLVQGVLAGVTDVNLIAARVLIESYDDGVARVLIDTIGIPWANVIFNQFEPGERILKDNRGHYLPYRAILRHLN